MLQTSFLIGHAANFILTGYVANLTFSAWYSKCHGGGGETMRPDVLYIKTLGPQDFSLCFIDVLYLTGNPI